MSFRPNGPGKKPSGGRPVPKKLFSLDSLRKEKSLSGGQSDSSAARPGHAPSSDSLHKLVDTFIPEGEEDPFAANARWTEKPLVTSPKQEEVVPVAKEKRGKKSAGKPAVLDLDPNIPKDILASANDTTVPPPSPSRRRWDTVRHHVLPISEGTETPSRPSSPSESSIAGSARPSTPKGYRFGQKRHVRQIVDEARAVDEVRRFADELQRACWSVRFGSGAEQGRLERDTHGTTGSGGTLPLPFMPSSSSLPMSSSASVISLQSSYRAPALPKRHPSVRSLATTNGGRLPVMEIGRAIAATTSSNRPKHLPHEHLVLSTLLIPFVSLDSGADDHEMATETFQMIIQTFKAPSPEDHLQRCLWCCKAAVAPGKARTRIVVTLGSLLSPKDSDFFADTPVLLQTLIQALISLVADLSAQSDSSSDVRQISGYIQVIRSKDCGRLSKQAIEKEYGVRFGKDDKDADVRAAVITEAAVKCLEFGHENRRRWVLNALLEEFWPTPEPSLVLTSLLTCIHWRKLKTFIASTFSLLSSSAENAELDGEIITRFFRSRILPEVEAMRTDDAAEIQTQIVRLVLELICADGNDEREYLLMHFCDWYQKKKDWRETIHSTMGQFIKSAEWPKILFMIPALINELPGEVQLPMVIHIMPCIYERLVGDPPDAPNMRLTSFLSAMAEAFPKVFYKPMFSCAAATKDSTIINQLLVLRALSLFIPDIWAKDPDMIAFALLGDSSSTHRQDQSVEAPTWGKTRTGQSVLLLEVTQHLALVRNSKDMAQTVSAVKFATVLEARLGAAIVTKEQTTLIPDSQRILLCDLFREVRLLTRSLKPATWLPPVVTWFSQWRAENEDGDTTINLTRGREDPGIAVDKLSAIYTQAQDMARGAAKRSTLITSPRLDRPTMSRDSSEDRLKVPPTPPFDGQLKFLASLTRALKSTMLELLVCISGLLAANDYARVVEVLWDQCMDDMDPHVIAPACFLVMQCAEKSPNEFTQLLEDNLASSDAAVRLKALQKFSKLASWRYQMLSQEVILDRAHRRPFKLARPPILFVATDIGSSAFSYEEADDEWRDTHGYILPLELRRRLSEIGWAQEDRKVDQKTQWIRTPMSLLPSLQLDKLDSSYVDALKDPDMGSPSASPEPSPTKGSRGDTSLTRQDSATSGRAGIRRRPVFVMTLISLFPRLTSMLLDQNFAVANAALELIMDFMRDDPALLARMIFNILSSDEQGLTMAITSLRAFLHARQTLPPAMAHHVLNHLTGFLKSSMKQTIGPVDPLQSFAYTMPLIANFITQVNNLSLREIRRAKIDMFLTPTGSLWFPPSAPMGPQFPRSLKGARNPFEPLPPRLVWITLIRSSQNKLFLNMLKRDPRELKVIRKHMTRLSLPSLDDVGDDSPPTLADMLPRRRDTQTHDDTNITLKILSATLARSYLLLICQVFQSMSRHQSDRNELAVLVDGVTRILITHGHDINVVAHCMIAFMIASTRFRRLFTSGGGYTLFMAAVVKVYVEADGNAGIRAAIEYATNRFYALHEDSFLFQSFDIISNLVTMSGIDESWTANGVYSLFSSLRNSVPLGSDAAGIQGMNKVQEKEALMMSMVEEGPQTFLASFRRGNGKQEKEKTQNVQTAPVPEEYEGRRLSMDNLVRLFLTVIAHNPGIQRAENFLKILRLLAPELYHASNSARTVLRDGILALANILLSKAGGKSKIVEGSAQVQPSENPSLETISEGISQMASQSTPQGATPSDTLAMRLDYLALVVVYTEAGGAFTNHASQRILEVVKAVLRDSRASTTQVAKFVTDYARSILIRDPLPSVKQVNATLSDLAPIVSAYSGSVSFSGLYDVVAELASNSIFATEPSFATIVVTQYCRYGLDACELAASENLLFRQDIRGSLLSLLDSAVSMASIDVVAEIEAKTPSRDLLAGIVLPFALRLRTTEEVTTASQYTEVWRREAHTRAWVHLLNYVLGICQSAEELKGPRKASTSNRRKSSESDRLDTGAVMTFAMALQVLKVIVVRAEDDISSSMPGIWARMGGILKSILSDGNASFTFQATHDYSEPPSPGFSPRQSTFSLQPAAQINFPSSASLHQRRALCPPRVIDYLTWSFIQWLWLRRNPLIIQMRLFVQERIAQLAHDLVQGSALSSVSAPRSRRISTVFSKPRRSMMVHSTPSSAASTPRNSIYLSGSMSFPQGLSTEPSASSLSPSAFKDSTSPRQPGYSRSPYSPSNLDSQELTVPRIVHLGPVHLSSASRSPGGSQVQLQSVRSMAKEMMVTSPMLIRATYRRIRLVQHLMGFRDLLPMGDDGGAFGEDDHPDSDVKTWTKRDALEAIVQETRDLLEESRDSFDDFGDESAVMVDSEETLAQMQEYGSSSSH